MLTAHCQFLLFCSVPLAFFLCLTPGCRMCWDPDVEHAETRVLNMSRPGCHTMPFRISVFSFSFPLFSFARMCIYYNVSLLSDFSSSFKNMFFNMFINQRVTKKFLYFVQKIPLYIWLVFYKVLLLHPLSRTGAAMFWHSDRNGVGTLTYFFCLGLVSFWNLPFEKAEWKKTSENIWKIWNKVLTFAPAFKK